jgi:hypothetical protein
MINERFYRLPELGKSKSAIPFCITGSELGNGRGGVSSFVLTILIMGSEKSWLKSSKHIARSSGNDISEFM